MPVLVGGDGGKPPVKHSGNKVGWIITGTVFGLFAVLAGLGTLAENPEKAEQEAVREARPTTTPSTSAFERDRPAYELAAIDRNLDQIAQYERLLDTVDPTCREGRQQISNMVYESTRIAREGGNRTTNLEILNGLSVAIEPLANAGQSTDCAEALAALVTLMKPPAR